MDSGYKLEEGYMSPYPNTRYTDREFASVDDGHLGKTEKFNKAHSKLHVVVKNAFGAVKGKWKILKLVLHYDLEMQKKSNFCLLWTT
jgi:hypothetical protein